MPYDLNHSLISWSAAYMYVCFSVLIWISLNISLIKLSFVLNVYLRGFGGFGVVGFWASQKQVAHTHLNHRVSQCLGCKIAEIPCDAVTSQSKVIQRWVFR